MIWQYIDNIYYYYIVVFLMYTHTYILYNTVNDKSFVVQNFRDFHGFSIKRGIFPINFWVMSVLEHNIQVVGNVKSKNMKVFPTF